MFHSRWAAFGAMSLGGVMMALLLCGSLSLTQGQDDTPREKKNTEKPDAGKGREEVGDVRAGRDVFRFETFGNEGFWTDAMRLPKGMADEKFTPLQALEAGLHVDVEALDDDTKKALGAEFKTDLSPKSAPLLNDPKTTVKLIQANAVIGVVPKGDKVGISCAICHTITDNSVFEMPGKGSVGRRLDGRATHSLDMGKLLALAANSRAYYPNLQLELGGKTIGRAPKGIRRDSTEEEVDAYLKNAQFYPRGTFDETQDGIGNPVQNTPLFRQDLAGPYGSNGLHEKLEGISNASYTTNLDPTTLATPEGLEFLRTLGGKAGEELHANYVHLLKETGVKGYPFVKAEKSGKAGHRDTPVGRQVDKQQLLDMKAYLMNLGGRRGDKGEAEPVARGRKLFEAGCARCHNADPNEPVPPTIVALQDLWPGYKPEVSEKRKPPLSPITDSPGSYDDKVVVVDASERGEKRGIALPLLLDLARKPAFLHDNSVPSLEGLFDPQRGEKEPHPFYLQEASQRADMVAFLKSLTAAPRRGDKPADEKPKIKQPGPSPKALPRVPKADPAAAEVPEGYRVEVFLDDLTYPSCIEFDDDGNVYVAEAGTIDGDLVAPTRIRRGSPAGPGAMRWTVIADQFNGPVCDLLWHKGLLYVAHRGKISVVEKGQVRDLVTDLPAFGDHHTNQMTVGPDGKIYFGQGSVTNSGVVGLDSYLFGWLALYPDAHDRPAKDIQLRGQAFETTDPLAAARGEESKKVKTSAFQPFGKSASSEVTVQGQVKSNGTVLRMDADGSNLEVYAWGFRNPFGLMWGPDQKLYASDNGYDERGSRPVANSADNLWLVREGKWYGWPDFSSGIPVTDEQFRPKEGPAPEFLLAQHPLVEKPLMTFPPHASVTKIEFDRSGQFGFKGQMFLAASGDYAPLTARKQERVGYWVKRIDPTTGKAEDFFRAKKAALGPEGLEYVTTAGPRRPVDVRLSPRGDSLYVVDIGAVHFTQGATGPVPRPYPTSGVIWRITRVPATKR